MQTKNMVYVKCERLLDRMETDRVTVCTEEERPQTDRAETSLLDMYDEILVQNETTEQINKTAQHVSEINCFTGDGDIRKCQYVSVIKPYCV